MHLPTSIKNQNNSKGSKPSSNTKDESTSIEQAEAEIQTIRKEMEAATIKGSKNIKADLNVICKWTIQLQNIRNRVKHFPEQSQYQNWKTAFLKAMHQMNHAANNSITHPESEEKTNSKNQKKKGTTDEETNNKDD